ncbi:MAG TPA: alpha/beta fold hydrolase, partial [Blastocatellia bacterium]|nr:alpha/beta fold hydrolase [Blastocatellia bacterium]
MQTDLEPTIESGSGRVTEYIVSRDGTRIAYDDTGVGGDGPPLVLLHGGVIQTRTSWHDSGYVERLAQHHRVITIDLRGHGESDHPVEPGAYSAGKLIADIQAVVDACGIARFIVWGFSFGGTIALQLASRSEKVTGAIIGGSHFGPIFSKEDLEGLISSMEEMARAAGEERWEDMTAEQRTFATQADLSVAVAIFKAFEDWHGVEPGDLLCPAFVYCGSENE